MYTRCLIQWADDNSTHSYIITSTDGLDKNDDAIFFYGMSRDRLLEACEAHELCEGEWYVVAVYETSDNLNELL